MGRKMDKIQKLTINCIVLISFSSATFTDELKDNINSKKKNIADLRPEAIKESKKLNNNFERIISIWK